MSFDAIPATLRRRAMALEKMGHDAQWCEVFRVAAGELKTRMDAAAAPEQTAIECIWQVRRLRNAIHQTFNNSAHMKMPRHQQELLFRPLILAINSVKEPGVGRAILAVEIGTNATRAFIEARVAELLDSHFNKPQPGGTDGETTRTQHTDHAEEEGNEEDREGRRDAQQEPQPGVAGGAAAPGDEV